MRVALLILFSSNSNAINKLIICTYIKSQYKQELVIFFSHFYLQTAADIHSSPLNVLSLFCINVTLPENCGYKFGKFYVYCR